MSPLFQPLEARKLLSVVVADGVLTVTGTSKNDKIAVVLSKDGETITVAEASGNRFRKKAPITSEFAAADVTSIVVNAGDGNDSVVIRSAKRGVPFSIGATINGDAGNDNLAGAAGNDTINGGEGDDNLFGNKGTDLLNGGLGDDLLVGGAAIDTLNGNDGDDLLKSAGDGVIDIVDGGSDSATTGEDDQDSVLSDDGESPLNALIVEPSDLWHAPAFGNASHGGRGGHHGHNRENSNAGGSSNTAT